MLPSTGRFAVSRADLSLCSALPPWTAPNARDPPCNGLNKDRKEHEYLVLAVKFKAFVQPFESNIHRARALLQRACVGKLVAEAAKKIGVYSMNVLHESFRSNLSVMDVSASSKERGDAHHWYTYLCSASSCLDIQVIFCTRKLLNTTTYVMDW